MRIRFTIDIERKQPPVEYGEPEMGTTASQVELDGQQDGGELKTHRLTEPVRMGFQKLLGELQ